MGQFDMDHLIDDIAQDLQYAAVCYGPTLQGAQLNEVFAIAALRATNIFDLDDIREPDQFTPIRWYYETAASPYQMINSFFRPHEDVVDPGHVAPPCP